VVRSELEFGVLPWANATISGWVLDPDRKKMSKSKGNVVTPMPLLETHGADAVRYWAASGRPGTDTAVDDAQMKVGRRLAIKILNASRFALGRLGDNPVPPIDQVTAPIDVDLIANLRELVAEVTTAFEDFDYARALERTESFFWRYCDDYVELVKVRAYGNGTDPATLSAQAALAHSLSTLLRLFAPFLPFVTEEVWQWWQEGSIHNAAWPTFDELTVAAPRSEGVFDATSEVLSQIRREKTASKRSMRTPVDLVVVTNTPDFLEKVSLGLGDLKDAGGAEQVELNEGTASVAVTLAPEEPEAS
jgi:valyl-tRNA synthetase